MKRIFHVVILFMTISLLSITADAQTTPAADSVKTAVVKVGNLTCNGDMPTIKKQLLNQEGIDEVTFTPRTDGTSTFTVHYHSAMTNRKKIEKVIETTPGCDDKSTTPYRVKKEKDKE